MSLIKNTTIHEMNNVYKNQQVEREDAAWTKKKRDQEKTLIHMWVCGTTPAQQPCGEEDCL